MTFAEENLMFFLWPSQRYRLGILAILLAAASPLLGGCVELVPQQVTQRVVIHEDKTYRASYMGHFEDVHTIIAAVNADKRRSPSSGKREIREAEASALDRARKHPAFRSIRTTRPHRFVATFEEDGKLGSTGTLSLVATHGEREAIPRLFGLALAKDNETIASADLIHGKNGLYKELADLSSDENHLGRAVKRLLTRFEGTASIEVAADRVERHNADSIRKLANGRSLYTWSVRARDSQPMEFVAFLGDKRSAQYKLDHSPAGIPCRDVIGTDCKCGPFVLVAPVDDKPIARAGYELRVQARVLRGCTAEDGSVAAVNVETTGGACSLRLLPPAESEAQCPN